MGHHIRVKICGVTDESEAIQIAELGVDAVGLNFHPPSPRCVDDERAGRIARSLPVSVQVFGVFVNVPFAVAGARLSALGRAGTVQMHGEHTEPPGRGMHPFVPAFAIRCIDDLTFVNSYLETCRQGDRLPTAILLDGHAPGLHGGTGRTAPWDLIAEFSAGVPVLLAGGLTPENVAEAVRRVRPWGVDVASGVESAPGRKDLERVKRFVDAARSAAAGL
jgi:phosphoribosylanthranilate isomerase